MVDKRIRMRNGRDQNTQEKGDDVKPCWRQKKVMVYVLSYTDYMAGQPLF